MYTGPDTSYWLKALSYRFEVGSPHFKTKWTCLKLQTCSIPPRQWPLVGHTVTRTKISLNQFIQSAAVSTLFFPVVIFPRNWTSFICAYLLTVRFKFCVAATVTLSSKRVSVRRDIVRLVILPTSDANC
jgi:hypothetical protein